MPTVETIGFPAECSLYARLGEATFHDAFEADLADASLAPIEIALRFLRATPDWVETLLGIRNRAVSLVGIRDVGALGAVSDKPAGGYKVGDKLSFFDVFAIGETEVLLGADDSHLDVRIAFVKRNVDGRVTYALCSWVRTHNALGRLYMIPVGPMHKLIVKSAMRGLVV
jgi:hypothetical protein